MASFVRHVQFSSALGVGYTGALRYFDVEWTHGILAGVCCGVAGMLPDLDSDSGRPMRELFPLTAAVVPMLMLPRLEHIGFSWDAIILIFALTYAFIRYGLMHLFKRFTVHRGMFHSIPAGLIAAEIAFLSHNCPVREGPYVLAGGVFLGFLSHLILDEIYAIKFVGLWPKLNKASGTAFKLASKSMPATIATWSILSCMTYLVLMDIGYVPSIPVSLPIIHSESHDHAEKKRLEFAPPQSPTVPVSWPQDAVNPQREIRIPKQIQNPNLK